MTSGTAVGVGDAERPWASPPRAVGFGPVRRSGPHRFRGHLEGSRTQLIAVLDRRESAPDPNHDPANSEPCSITVARSSKPTQPWRDPRNLPLQDLTSNYTTASKPVSISVTYVRQPDGASGAFVFARRLAACDNPFTGVTGSSAPAGRSVGLALNERISEIESNGDGTHALGRNPWRCRYGNRRSRIPQPGTAQYLLAAGAVDGADRHRRLDRRPTGFSFFAGSPFIGLLVFLGVAFGFMFAIEKFKNSAIGVGCCWRSRSSWA